VQSFDSPAASRRFEFLFKQSFELAFGQSPFPISL